MEAAFRQSGVGTTPGARHALGAAGELCRAAFVAAATGQFVLRDTVLQFALAAAGGVAIGLAAGR